MLIVFVLRFVSLFLRACAWHLLLSCAHLRTYHADITRAESEAQTDSATQTEYETEVARKSHHPRKATDYSLAQ